MKIIKIDYFTFMQCETLAKLDKEFRFTDGIKINSEWYPMPKFGKDLILQIEPSEINRPIKKFDFNSYAEGFDAGYSRPMILTNEKHLLNAAKCNLPAYFVSDGIAEKEQCSDFGFSVGKCYQSWEYICDNINDFKSNNKKFFTSNLSDEALNKIFQKLCKENKLPKNTDAGLWLYWFNRNPMSTDTKQLDWEGRPSMLTNVIQQICGEADADAIMAAFGVKKCSPTQSKHINTDIGKTIAQIITIEKAKN